MDMFLTPVLRTVILLVGATNLTLHQTHKPRRYKDSVGGSYILVYDGEFIYFTFADLESGAFKEKSSRGKLSQIQMLSDFDYKQFVELFRKEFDEK